MNTNIVDQLVEDCGRGFIWREGKAQFEQQSNGYLEYVFRKFALEQFGVKIEED